MTKGQIKNVEKMRNDGFGYAEIARALDVNVSTVKSHCRAHGLTEKKPRLDTTGLDTCPVCGMYLVQVPKGRPRKFCSQDCRMKWWSQHRGLTDMKTFYDFTCANCHKPFKAYGNNLRKYCCFDCYIEGRFGKLNENIERRPVSGYYELCAKAQGK